MGQEINEIPRGDVTRPEFRHHLREETLVLKRWFDEKKFQTIDTPMVGFELEGWLSIFTHYSYI